MAAFGLAALASGCVNPSQRIATGLERYGIDQTQAQCVGDRLEAKLSIGQLQQLGTAASSYGNAKSRAGPLTIGDYVRAAGKVRDPKVPFEVGRAALACGMLAAPTG